MIRWADARINVIRDGEKAIDLKTTDSIAYLSLLDVVLDTP